MSSPPIYEAPPLPKLDKRLSVIKNNVSAGYDHIWDCCCDHGQLGMHLLDQGLASNIHFVDIVPELIEALQNKLTLHFPNHRACAQTHQWHTHCLNATKLPINETAKNARHLVIIAGVGGDLCTQLVRALHAEHPHANIDYLLCPVRHLYALRSTLKTMQFRVLNECLVEENKRIYEVILTSAMMGKQFNTRSTPPLIHELGEQLWQGRSAVIQSYLSLQIAHYARKADSGSDIDKSILTQLRSIQA